MYFDCSSYARFVRECAGLPTVTAFTGEIFKDRSEFKDNDTSNLKPGDLIGWPNDNTFGHVFIYLGDGLFGDAHGGSGKEPGKAIGNNYSLGELKDVVNRKGPGQLYIKR
jgi:cell wall-associated NlpC family hydrolase